MEGTRRPYEGPDPYIFVSYARKDADRVFPLIDALCAAGYRVWYDAGIHAGAHWTETLIEQVENCGVFCPLYSAAFNASRFGFEETEYAYREDKTIVPVYLEEVEKKALRPLFRLLCSRQDLRLYRYDSLTAFMEHCGAEPVFIPCKAPAVNPAPVVKITPPQVKPAPIKPPAPVAKPAPVIPWKYDGDIQWYLDGDGALTIAKREGVAWDTVSMPDYVWTYKIRSTAPWYPDREKIHTVVIMNDINAIRESAFQGCTSLTAVTIPDSVTAIGYGAFYECPALRRVEIPAGADVGPFAFNEHTQVIYRARTASR